MAADEVHGHRLGQFYEMAQCRRLRQRELQAEWRGPPAADPAGHREPATPVPALHPGAEEPGAEDRFEGEHPADLLRRE